MNKKKKVNKNKNIKRLFLKKYKKKILKEKKDSLNRFQGLKLKIENILIS